MKKYLLSGAVVVVFVIYLLLNHQQSTSVVTTPTTTTVATGNGTTSVGSNPPPATASAGTYKDGTYKGSVADAYFGSLQVEAIIQGGKLADCIPLQYPQDSGHTLEISKTDLPLLKQEAIAAQSANVNIISGATQTSQAFQQSLGAALALAK